MAPMVDSKALILILCPSLAEEWGKNYDLSGKYSVEWKVNRIDKHGADFLSFGDKDQGTQQCSCEKWRRLLANN